MPLSYALIVTVKNGIASVTDVSGSVPDGSFEIAGDAHVMPLISITQRDTRNRYIIHSLHSVHPEDGRIWPEQKIIPVLR